MKQVMRLWRLTLQQVTQFFAHEQAYGQTLQYTARHLCSADHIYTRSNTDSATQFFSTKEQLTPQAAIVPINLVEEHQDFVVAQDIQDYPNNTTRFVVVRKREDKEQLDFRKHKTSLFIEFEQTCFAAWSLKVPAGPRVKTFGMWL